MRLQDGSRVCIIGGGPAGCFAAIQLLKLAREQGLYIEALIFEPRDFSRPGPGSCKGCAGILSASLVQSMRMLGLVLAEPVVQAELRAYVVHIGSQVTSIEQPNAHKQILSVYRGGGPRLHAGEALSSFDGYLLSQACARGATWIPAKVRAVEWEDGPLVRTAQDSFRADLVVLATGVNSRPLLGPVFNYQSPATVTMAQDEILRPDDWPEYKVAGFFGGSGSLVFGAIVPKRHYLNVSLLWRGSPADAIQQFYQDYAQPLERLFPGTPQGLCGCTPRIVVRPAKTYFGDRWVAIGDAAVSRLYKDGINSAFLTAKAAMRAAVEYGIARQDFERTYAPFIRRIAADNAYGQLMFDLSSRAMAGSFLARASVGCIRAEAGLEMRQRIFSRLTWGMLTGDEPYHDLFWLVFKPRGLVRLGRELWRAACEKLN